MTKHVLRLTAALLVVLFVGAWSEARKTFTLENAAPSIDVLFERFFAALDAKDAAALEKLRITEREYRSFILPGSAKEGEPPQLMADRESEFFWQMLNTKSTYSSWALLEQYAGRGLKLKSVEYEKGVRRYAWYVAYRDPELTLEDAAGRTIRLPVGAIADVDGQFKFIGFNSDD